LKEFCAKAAAATLFVQQKAELDTFDKPHTGIDAEGGGLVGLLVVIESDCARLGADIKAAEVTAQNEYDMFTLDSKFCNVGVTVKHICSHTFHTLRFVHPYFQVFYAVDAH